VSPDRGLIDTSALVDLDRLIPRLPSELAISALTLAELACGPHAASDERERARRQNHLQQVEASLGPLSFDPHRLPLYTLNAADFGGLDDLVEIVDLGSSVGKRS
jgi:hypothetical protein